MTGESIVCQLTAVQVEIEWGWIHIFSGCGDGTAFWREWVGMAVEMGWSVWDGNSLRRGVDLLSVPV